jgi:hypothetical protein
MFHFLQTHEPDTDEETFHSLEDCEDGFEWIEEYSDVGEDTTIKLIKVIQYRHIRTRSSKQIDLLSNGSSVISRRK